MNNNKKLPKSLYDVVSQLVTFIRSGKNTRGFSRGMNCHDIVSI